MSNHHAVWDELHALLARVEEQKKQIYVHYQDLVSAVLTNQIVSEREIEAIMDGLLDFCDDEKLSPSRSIDALPHRIPSIALSSLKESTRVDGMFGRKKKQIPKPMIDITQKRVNTWWGGTKLVPTTKKEQRTMKEYLQKNHPEYTVVDSVEKKRLQREAQLQWIDEVEALDALFVE